MSRAAFVLGAALLSLACASQADLESGGAGGSNAQSSAGAGGDAAPSTGGAGDAPGAAGSNNRGGGNGGGGTGGSGVGGENPSVGGQGGSFDAGASPSCDPSYDSAAPWPGRGRCERRQGRVSFTGPKAFGGERHVELGEPVRTTPIVGADAVFVATTKGVRRFDRELLDATGSVHLTGDFPSEPLLAEGRVYAVRRDGTLVWAPQETAGKQETLSLLTEAEAEAEAKPAWLFAPVARGGILYVASPSGDLVRVALSDAPTLLGRVPGPAAATGAPASDGQGAIYLPTAVGLFFVDKSGTSVRVLDVGPTVGTVIGLAGGGAIFGGESGEVFRVALTSPGAEALPGATLAGGVHGLVDLGAPRVGATSANALRVLTLNDSEKGPALDEADGTPLYTAGGPLVASPSVDEAGTQYLSSSDGTLYVLDEQGAVLDLFLAEGALTAQPALTPEAVYVGSDDGRVYRLAGTDAD